MVKKYLPKPSDDNHLSDFGYHVDKKMMSRHTSLKKASKKIGTLTTMKRLNLIRNLTKKGSKNKEILSKDVDFMKKVYAREKERQKKSKAGAKKKNSKK